MSRGVLLSLGASLLFAALYYLSSWLEPLTGLEIFGWRILLTFPCLMIYMTVAHQWDTVREILRRVLKQPWLILALLLSSFLLAVQLWLFLWAPGAGRGLNVSLGYFLLPLTMILVGRLLFNERLSRFQQWATVCALVGVANQLFLVGALAWETLLVALGYPLYFSLRRWISTNHLGGMWFDMALMLPVAAVFAWSAGTALDKAQHYSQLLYLVPLMGLLSAWALVYYLMASRLLSLSLFGLMGYVEPVMMVGVSLLLGERLSGGEWATYIPIWIAVMILVAEGVRHVWRRRWLHKP